MSCRRQGTVLVAIMVLAGPALAPPARAADAPAVPDARVMRAFKACQTGQVAAGTDLLAELYADTQDPQFVVAQGRCLQKNGKPHEATRAYREYLRVATAAPAEERARVERYLEEAEAEARRQPPPPKAEPLRVAPLPLGSVPPPSELKASRPPPAREEARPLYARWPFWAVVGGAVAAGVVTALILSNRGGEPGASCPAGVRCMHF